MCQTRAWKREAGSATSVSRPEANIESFSLELGGVGEVSALVSFNVNKKRAAFPGRVIELVLGRECNRTEEFDS